MLKCSWKYETYKMRTLSLKLNLIKISNVNDTFEVGKEKTKALCAVIKGINKRSSSSIYGYAVLIWVNTMLDQLAENKFL